VKKITKSLLVAGISLAVVGAGSISVLSNVSSAASAPLKVGRIEAAAHGTKCFTVAVAVVQNGVIVAASLDDYQFLSSDTAKGVPNSDKDFGQNYKDPAMVLASKKTNTKSYSEHMKEAGKSTVAYDKNIAIIEKFATGRTIKSLEATLAKKSKEEMVDAVSGATLVDTEGYLQAILDAAKAAK
jgi:major membrane immunogen (membrane-anchored lipoprotein)